MSKPFLATILLGLSMLCGQAGYTATLAPTGFYFDANAGWGKIRVDDGGNRGFAGNFNVGYAFNRFVGIEGGYSRFRNTNNLHNNQAFDVAGKVSYPFANGVRLFGKLGVASSRTSYVNAANGTQRETTALLAAGLGYALNENVAIQGQFLNLARRHDVPNMYQGTVGVLYHYG